jgi:predicted flap endonuclease-1-like 5' DNA nuclease
MFYLLLQIFLCLLLALLVGLAIGIWLGRRYCARRTAILTAQVRDLTYDLEAVRAELVSATQPLPQASSGEVAEAQSAKSELTGKVLSVTAVSPTEAAAAQVSLAEDAPDDLPQPEAASTQVSLAEGAPDDLPRPEVAPEESPSAGVPSAQVVPPTQDSTDEISHPETATAELSPPEVEAVASQGKSQPAPGESNFTPPKAGKPDDLKRVWGIGPKMESLLRGAGIETFEQLSQATVTRLNEVVQSSGSPRLSDIANVETWAAQADLAGREEWGLLEAYQKRLSWDKGGKPV